VPRRTTARRVPGPRRPLVRPPVGSHVRRVRASCSTRTSAEAKTPPPASTPATLPDPVRALTASSSRPVERVGQLGRHAAELPQQTRRRIRPVLQAEPRPDEVPPTPVRPRTPPGPRRLRRQGSPNLLLLRRRQPRRVLISRVPGDHRARTPYPPTRRPRLHRGLFTPLCKSVVPRRQR
jgi:hypothetical protein